MDEERLMDFPSVFKRFITMEPPLVVGLFFVLVINSSVGLFWALFVRDTAAGPGGELGKGIKALRKEVGTRRPPLFFYCVVY